VRAVCRTAQQATRRHSPCLSDGAARTGDGGDGEERERKENFCHHRRKKKKKKSLQTGD